MMDDFKREFSIRDENVLRSVYIEVEKCIKKIDFSSLWPGFHPYEFALYNRKCICLQDETIGWDDRFVGNTAIAYKNSYIAIWELSNEELSAELDLDMLAAALVHEMFHAYQRELGETRFPNDLLFLKFPRDVLFYQIKYEENKLLVSALESTCKEEKTSLFQKFCAVRKKRYLSYRDILLCEYQAETIEGTAEYVGCSALSQLSEKKYQNCIKNYAQKLMDCNSLQLDVRRISYYIGTLMLVIAKEASIPYIDKISNQTRTIYELLSNNFEDLTVDIILDSQMKTVVHNTDVDRKQQMKVFSKEMKNKVEGNFIISGYDPMNMFRVKDEILCRYFIKLTNTLTGEEIVLFGKTLLFMKNDSINEVVAYIRD